jgi:hypothetical protein
MVAAMSLAAAGSSNAAIEVTFDAADSSISSGLYAFDLSGVTLAAGNGSYNSDFVLQYWTLLSPAPGNTLDPLVSEGSPSAWNLNNNSEDVAEWYLENTSGNANGTFVVQATPNLYGSITWTLQMPDPSTDISGTVNIVPVPEPATLFAGVAALCCALVPYRKGFSSRRARA